MNVLSGSGISLPDWLDLDIQKLDPIHRKVLYWNIVFPGAGFAYAGDLGRFLIFGGGAMGLLVAGMFLAWYRVQATEIPVALLFQQLILPIGLMALVVVVHLGAILSSTKSRIRTSSTLSAIIYIAISVIITGFGLILFLWEIWRQMVI